MSDKSEHLTDAFMSDQEENADAKKSKDSFVKVELAEEEYEEEVYDGMEDDALR